MLHLGPMRSPKSKHTPDVAAPDWAKRFTDLAATSSDARLKAFYARGVPAANTALALVPMVALDIETTGLDPRHDEIVSIGLVPMRLDVIRASASRHWIVRPLGRLNAESVAIHAITHAQIETAPDLAQILGEVLDALAGSVVVVHCRSIERSFLDAALRARIGEGIEFPVIDTMELEARLHRREQAGLFARLFRRKRTRLSIRLADARARYHLPRYRAHHALTDALATAELLQAQLAHRFSPETLVEALWQ